MDEGLITYFGYGSLVNRATRPSGEQAHKARLYGWGRAWSHRVPSSNTRPGGCTSLTVEKLDNTESGIDGVLVSIPISELPVLDQREAGYQRLELPRRLFDVPEHFVGDSVYVYVSDEHHNFDANPDFPVLQSYIDCVMAGYQQLFGELGVEAFLHSTRGWEKPVDEDRFAPRYPRAVSLSQNQLQHFDALLSNHRLRDHKSL